MTIRSAGVLSIRAIPIAPSQQGAIDFVERNGALASRLTPTERAALLQLLSKGDAVADRASCDRAQVTSLLLLRGLPAVQAREVVAALGGSRFLNALLARVTNNELKQIMLEAPR